MSRDRRSSSTVREFIENISNKVLRRGLSPLASTPDRRRCSAGDISNENLKNESIGTFALLICSHLY